MGNGRYRLWIPPRTECHLMQDKASRALGSDTRLAGVNRNRLNAQS